MTIGPDPARDATAALLRHVERHRGLARLVLLWERVWPAIWPALGLCGIFVCAALLDLFSWVPGWPHAALLVGFAAGIAGLLWRGIRRIRRPDNAEADRRLETVSGLRHRPLAVLTDRPAHPGAETLWRAHVARAAAQLGRLRVGLPHPGLPARDPRAFRGALVVGLVACLGIAGTEAPHLLLRALSPGFAPPPPAPASQVQAWITPPGYTGLAPIFLRPDTTDIEVPSGAHLTVSVTGGSGKPSLMLGSKSLAFQALDAASFQADQDLSAGGRLEIRRHGTVLGAWELTVIADTAPEVSFYERPGRARNTSARAPQVRLPWQVEHRYGVVSLQAELRLRDRPDAPPLIVAIPLPGGAPKSAKGARLQDLSAHPWAGLPVIARLVAKDAPGLTGTSADAGFDLPERRFENPLARAILQVRRELSRRPDERAPAIVELDQIAGIEDAWAHDWGAYLNLRSIIAQLHFDLDPHAVDAVQARMWQLALHLEEAAPERTARELEQARQALRELMDQQKNGQTVDKAELDRRMKEVEQALQRHLQALADQARRDPGTEDFNPDEHPLDARDMQRLAEEARKAAEEGRMDDAQQKLAELDKLLEELQNARPEHGKMTERERQRAEQRQRGQQQMSALQDIVRREGALLDRSQERDAARDPTRDAVDPRRSPYPPRPYPWQPPGQSPQGQSPQGQSKQGQSSPGQSSQDQQQQAQVRAGEQRVQQALRRALGELMQQYGDLTGQVPANLGEADTAMRDASQALAQARDGQAASSEQKAIEALQKGGRSMSMQMAQQFGRDSDEQGDENGDEQDGDGDQAGSPQDGDRDGGPQYGRDDGRAGRPWMPHGRADRRADDRRDPLGRPLKEGTSGADESGDTRVPEQMEEARTRAIQEELRRRDADRSRPQPELDYIERLLKSF